MASLPTPGKDAGTWGSILNEFLLVSLNSDGSLRSSALSKAGGVTTSSIGSANGIASLNSSSQIPSTQLGSGTASSSNFLRGDGTWAIPNSGSSALAQDTDVAIVSPSNNQVLTYNSGANKWENESLPSAPVTSVFGRTGAVTATTGDYTASQVTGALVSSNNLSDVSNESTAFSNIKQSATSGSTGVIQLAGDLGNTATSPEVVSTHLSSPLPIGQGGTGSATQNFVDLSTNQTIGGTKTFSSTITGNISGSAATATTASTVTTIPALSGDVTSSGSSNVTTVAKLNGITAPASAPSGAGQVLTSTSSSASAWSTPASAPVNSVFGRTGVVVASSGDYTVSQVTGAAPLSGPTFTGTPLAPTATTGTNTTQLATTAFVGTAVSNGSAANATSSTPGLVQLDGDLGNSATSPEVVSTHLSSALPVSQGGTGQTSLTAYELIAAGTTGSGVVQQVGLGSMGQVLTSNSTGALPSMQNLPAASTTTSGIIKIDGTASDIQPLTTSAVAGSNGVAADSGHSHPITVPAVGIGAAGLGLLMLSVDPRACSTGVTLTISDNYVVWVVVTAAVSGTVNHLGVLVQTAGATTGSGINEMAIYAITGGAPLATTGDMTTALESTGMAEGTISGGYSITAGTNYYLALINNFTGTALKIACLQTNFSTPVVNGYYLGGTSASHTSWPSLTPSSLSGNDSACMYAR